MVRKITGLLLVLVGGIILWLFPALVTPREKLAYEGQDVRSYCASEIGKQKRYHLLTMRVCLPAAFAMGVGATLLLSRKRNAINPEA
jgi:hypothetical protein